MIIFSKNVGGMALLAPPGYAYGLYSLMIAMIKIVYESASIDYCLFTVLVSCTVNYSFLVERYAYIQHVFGKKDYIVHDVHQLLFTTRFSVITKFSMSNGSHMDAHRIFDLSCSLVQVWF